MRVVYMLLLLHGCSVLSMLAAHMHVPGPDWHAVRSKFLSLAAAAVATPAVPKPWAAFAQWPWKPTLAVPMPVCSKGGCCMRLPCTISLADLGWSTWLDGMNLASNCLPIFSYLPAIAYDQ